MLLYVQCLIYGNQTFNSYYLDMEELLNKLIQRWWKPFGIEWIKEFHLKAYECERWTNKIMIKHFEWFFTDWIRTSDHPWDIWTRMYVVYWLKHITAKESWLRQFCLENNLVKLIENPNKNKCPRDRMSEEEFRMWEYNVYYSFSNKKDIHKRYEQGSLTYWLIESALCDEDKLEKFLLDNIKI